jgi:hypothetical protein
MLARPSIEPTTTRVPTFARIRLPVMGDTSTTGEDKQRRADEGAVLLVALATDEG